MPHRVAAVNTQFVVTPSGVSSDMPLRAHYKPKPSALPPPSATATKKDPEPLREFGIADLAHTSNNPTDNYSCRHFDRAGVPSFRTFVFEVSVAPFDFGADGCYGGAAVKVGSGGDGSFSRWEDDDSGEVRAHESGGRRLARAGSVLSGGVWVCRGGARAGLPGADAGGRDRCCGGSSDGGALAPAGLWRGGANPGDLQSGAAQKESAYGGMEWTCTIGKGFGGSSRRLSLFCFWRGGGLSLVGVGLPAEGLIAVASATT